MPEITRNFEYRQVEPSRLFGQCLEAFGNIGGEIKGRGIISQKPFKGEISAFISSIWGWGGMTMKVRLTEDGEITRLEMTGYIAQLITRPLKEKMEEYIKELSMPSEWGAGFSPAQVASKAPIESRAAKWTSMDKRMLIFVLCIVPILFIGSFLLGIPEQWIVLALILYVYYYFRRLIKN